MPSNFSYSLKNCIILFKKFYIYNPRKGPKGDWDFRISDLVKIMKEQIFNPCGEFHWSSQGPVSQFHYPHLNVGAPGIFSDLLGPLQILKRNGCGKQQEANAVIKSLVKTDALIPEFAVEDLPSAELQPRFLRLQWRTYHWAEHSFDDKPKKLRTLYSRNSRLPTNCIHEAGWTHCGLHIRRKISS